MLEVSGNMLNGTLLRLSTSCFQHVELSGNMLKATYLKPHVDSVKAALPLFVVSNIAPITDSNAGLV